jgi:hypothetical protein
MITPESVEIADGFEARVQFVQRFENIRMLPSGQAVDLSSSVANVPISRLNKEMIF